jgi:hypothetical protein
MARTTVSPVADRPLFSGDALVDPAVLQERATTPIVEAMFYPAPNLPKARLAAVEVFPGRFMIGYRSDIFSRQDAAEIARLIVGPFVDITDEVQP